MNGFEPLPIHLATHYKLETEIVNTIFDNRTRFALMPRDLIGELFKYISDARYKMFNAICERKKLAQEYEELLEAMAKLKCKLSVVDDKLKQSSKDLFTAKYRKTPEEIMNMYKAKLRSAVILGGTGYRCWVSNVCGIHEVIDPAKYKHMQPGKREYEAYLLTHGTKMNVTKEVHTERWGN